MSTCEDCGTTYADLHPNLQLRTFHTRTDCIATLRRRRDEDCAKLDALARQISLAIAASTLLEDEALADPPEHEIVHLVADLRHKEQRYARQLTEAREKLAELSSFHDDEKNWRVGAEQERDVALAACRALLGELQRMAADGGGFSCSVVDDARRVLGEDV